MGGKPPPPPHYIFQPFKEEAVPHSPLRVFEGDSALHLAGCAGWVRVPRTCSFSLSECHFHDALWAFACVASGCGGTFCLHYAYSQPLLDAEVGTQQEVTCPAKVWVTQGLKPVLWAYQHPGCVVHPSAWLLQGYGGQSPYSTWVPGLGTTLLKSRDCRVTSRNSDLIFLNTVSVLPGIKALMAPVSPVGMSASRVDGEVGSSLIK